MVSPFCRFLDHVAKRRAFGRFFAFYTAIGTKAMDDAVRRIWF
jgi:hypothetical protein